jgi:hypothetical protein
MVKIAEFEITQRDLYMPESRAPIKGGVLDLRLVKKKLVTFELLFIRIDRAQR